MTMKFIWTFCCLVCNSRSITMIHFLCINFFSFFNQKILQSRNFPIMIHYTQFNVSWLMIIRHWSMHNDTLVSLSLNSTIQNQIHLELHNRVFCTELYTQLGNGSGWPATSRHKSILSLRKLSHFVKKIDN